MTLADSQSGVSPFYTLLPVAGGYPISLRRRRTAKALWRADLI
jgi:hypothetical protein